MSPLHTYLCMRGELKPKAKLLMMGATWGETDWSYRYDSKGAGG